MTSNARHSEHVRASQSGSIDAAYGTTLKAKPASPPQARRSRVTWVVAACACLTAFVIKLSQQWLEQTDKTNAFADMMVTFDWTALLLCICAVALLALQGFPAAASDETRQAPTGLIVSQTQIETPNIALPVADDARLRLAQSLSHELRTPLNAVIGFSDIMHHQMHGNLGHPKYHEYCAHISASSQSLLRAVDDILALNSATPTDVRKRVPLPVAKVLQEAWDENVDAENNNVAGALEISGDAAPQVIADPELLSHALKNIVDTLNRHTVSGSTVAVVIRNEGARTMIRCTAQTSAAQIVETAPLVADLATNDNNQRMSRHTLAEVAAEALVRSMDGKLMVRQPEDTDLFEMVCELPAPHNANTPISADRQVS